MDEPLRRPRRGRGGRGRAPNVTNTTMLYGFASVALVLSAVALGLVAWSLAWNEKQATYISDIDTQLVNGTIPRQGSEAVYNPSVTANSTAVLQNHGWTTWTAPYICRLHSMSFSFFSGRTSDFTGTLTLTIVVFDGDTYITHIFQFDAAEFYGVTEATRLAAGINSGSNTLYSGVFDLTTQNVMVPVDGIWMGQITASSDYNGDSNDLLGLWHYIEVL